METRPGRAVGRVGGAHQHHLHRAGAEHAGPQAGKAGHRGQAVAAVAGHREQRERGGDHAGQGGQLGEPVAGAGSATGAGAAGWCQPVQASVGAEPAADGDLGGQLAQLAAGVGAVGDQVDAAGAEVAADHRDEFCGRVQPPRSVLGSPQARQDGQADRPVGSIGRSVVGDQPERRAVSNQQGADEVQQDQAELVG